MATLFYLFGLFVFMIQLPLVAKWNKIFDKIRYDATFLKVTGEKKKKDKSDALIGFAGLSMVLMIFYTLIGLLTSNWFLFLSIICVSLIGRIKIKILNKVFSKFKYSNLHRIISFLMMITISGLTLLTVLNHFHFNIDFYELFKNIIK